MRHLPRAVQVALGTAYERTQAEYDAAASCRKAGKQHTWGKGRSGPREEDAVTAPGDAGLKVRRRWHWRA